jgi:hypothetical protein
MITLPRTFCSKGCFTLVKRRFTFVWVVFTEVLDLRAFVPLVFVFMSLVFTFVSLYLLSIHSSCFCFTCFLFRFTLSAFVLPFSLSFDSFRFRFAVFAFVSLRLLSFHLLLSFNAFSFRFTLVAFVPPLLLSLNSVCFRVFVFAEVLHYCMGLAHLGTKSSFDEAIRYLELVQKAPDGARLRPEVRS